MSMFKFGSSKQSSNQAASSSANNGCKAGAESMFDRLMESAPVSEPDALAPPHLAALASILGLHEDDIAIYIILWKVQAKRRPCFVYRDEWVSGMQSMRLDSIEKLKAAIPALRKDITVPQNFQSFYYFCFDWLREAPQAKIIPNETACVMWPILFTKTQFPLLDEWVTFMSDVYKKPVNKDLWQQTLAFAGTNIKDYDPDGAFPLAMDEFVGWMKQKQ